MNDKIKNAAYFYFAHVRQYPKLLTGVLISVPITIFVNNFLPSLIVAHVLSQLSTHTYAKDQIWPVFGVYLIAYIAILLIGIATWRLVDHFAWRLEAEVGRDMARRVFDHMLRESTDFHANNFSGSLVSQNNKLLGGYIRTSDTTIFSTYPLIIGIVLANIILAFKAPLFVVLLDVFSIGFLVIALKISRPVRAASSEVSSAESKQTGYYADAISNVSTIKSYARGGFERKHFDNLTLTTQKRLFEFARVHAKQMNYLGLLSRFISGASLAFAVVAVVAFKANLGTMFLILSYASSIVDQLFSFSNNSLRNYARALGDAADMVEILSLTPAVLDPKNPSTKPINDGSLILDNVTFQHSGSSEAIFEGLNLKIVQGEKVGVVGHSGSGKTTLTRLLLRFSDIDSGSILLGGQDIAKITQDRLHENIAYVPQEPLLFHRTIGENISYGNHESSKKDLLKAAKDAHAAEFIDKLPQGYDTLVGERGVKLSGGQRQRIAIARAMLKNAPVLVLDEATSALDSESEVLIQDALWKLMEGRTAIVIAHRLSTIQKMDRIIVMENGKIVEEGTHSDLLKEEGIYAKLWAHQSGGFIEE